MGGAGVVDEVVSTVGLWWPEADEERLREAAGAWERAAVGLDAAADAGRVGAAQAVVGWSGEAADRFAGAWRAQEAALGEDAAGCRALADALRRYADAVTEAKEEVVALAVTAGASIVAGVGLAWLTFGASAAAAAGVSASLVAAAQAIGVQLSATAARILGGALVGSAFASTEAMAVDLAVTQPLRVEVFGDGGYSVREVAGAAVAGGVAGAALGGVAGALGGARAGTGPGSGAGPGASTMADDLGPLDSAISAALDPAFRGSLGPLYRAGVHEMPQASFPPAQRETARLLAEEGASVHARADATTSTGALVRSSPEDRGRFTELAVPEAPSTAAVADEILDAGGRLGRQGGSGDLVLDGRAAGLGMDEAGEGLAAAVERARAQGLELPDSVRFVLGDGVSIHWP